MTPIQSDFLCYQLTTIEIAEALNWSPIQRAYLTNRLGEIAHVKLNIAVDPANMLYYVQQEAALAGQLNLLRELLLPVNNPATQSQNLGD